MLCFSCANLLGSENVVFSNLKSKSFTTVKNTVISPNFLVWKFCGKEQFPYNFGRIARNYAETVPFLKISTPGNQVKLRYFLQCTDSKVLLYYPLCKLKYIWKFVDGIKDTLSKFLQPRNLDLGDLHCKLHLKIY